MDTLTKKVLGIAAGITGAAFIGYCIYFDKKRRQDPNYKKIVRERRRRVQMENAGCPDIQNLGTEEELHRYYLQQLRNGEQMIEQGNYEIGVEHLTKAILVCENANVLLHFLRNKLPDHIFGMLIVKLQEFENFVDDEMDNTFGASSENSTEDASEND